MMMMMMMMWSRPCDLSSSNDAVHHRYQCQWQYLLQSKTTVVLMFEPRYLQYHCGKNLQKSLTAVVAMETTRTRTTTSLTCIHHVIDVVVYDNSSSCHNYNDGYHSYYYFARTSVVRVESMMHRSLSAPEPVRVVWSITTSTSTSTSTSATLLK